MDVVLDLAKHAQAVGGDLHRRPCSVLHFLHAQSGGRFNEYYKYISSQVDIGIALWSHPDSGLSMSPELCP